MKLSDYRGTLDAAFLEPILSRCFRMSDANRTICRLYFVEGVAIGAMPGGQSKQLVWNKLNRIRKKIEENDD